LPEDFSQVFVSFSGLQLDGIQLFDNLGNGPVDFNFTGMEVAAGGDLEVVLLQLGVFINAAELLLLIPSRVGVGNALDALLGIVVLGITLLE
jgi:hypothetical protein